MKKWKWAFIILLAINAAAVAIAAFLLFAPADNNAPTQNDIKEGKAVALNVGAKKDALNQLIDHYLKEEANADQYNYKVYLDDKVYFTGAIKAFGKDIDAKITFAPVVKKDGNMRLIVEDLSIGQLDIPVSFVLNYISTSYTLPEFVHIDERNHSIDVDLTEIELSNNYRAKAEKFDLKNDEIRFDLFVPLD
ncbi:YpmS family protein [Metabacillus sp. KIGAM252]|uniref:YpmS family protein n=1 Tax=Metabacillus flavus TaxID=2823519 RepID=A0ABS5LFK7_9BACI|nr:YpmS family protein [Metabacillus flavus]MBS2969303.1 YpmS family protein [Metabacillus flavus]